METAIFPSGHVLHPSVMFLLFGGCSYIPLGYEILHLDIHRDFNFLSFVVYQQYQTFTLANRVGWIRYDLRVFLAWIADDDCVL